MSTTTVSGKEPIIFAPINYIPVVTEYSWWSTKSGLRKFVIVSLRWDFDEKGNWPATVVLLEIQKTEPINYPWPDFVKLIEGGEMVKLN